MANTYKDKIKSLTSVLREYAFILAQNLLEGERLRTSGDEKSARQLEGRILNILRGASGIAQAMLTEEGGDDLEAKLRAYLKKKFKQDPSVEEEEEEPVEIVKKKKEPTPRQRREKIYPSWKETDRLAKGIYERRSNPPPKAEKTMTTLTLDTLMEMIKEEIELQEKANGRQRKSR